MDKELIETLKYLHLGGLLTHWDEYLALALKQRFSPVRLLQHVLHEEEKLKRDNARRLRLKRARIPELLDLATYPFDRQPKLDRKKVISLYDGFEYMTKTQNIVWMGPPGCGKTGLATSFLINAISRGYTGRFVSFPALIQELFASVADHSEKEVLKRYLDCDCLLIDEIGYVEVEPVQVGLFFTLMQQRHRHKPTLITTNLGFGEWRTFLKNDHLSAALMDRLTENSHVVNMKNCVSLRGKLARVMSFQDRRNQADRLRSVPLKAVLLASGAQADPQDPAKWHTTMGVLSVNGMKFINWTQGAGGGGAIDLAMHLHGMDFTSALQWLARRFSPSMAPDSSQPQTTELMLPVAESANLPRVIRYLAGKRRLPQRLLDPLIRDGRIYADARANAVFLLLGNENKTVGAELRGTTDVRWRGMAPGSHKNLGYFSAGTTRSSDVVLCESAIDAISCAALYPECQCISTSGARHNPAWLNTLLNRGLRIRCGFDADPTGDHMAQAMIAAHPPIQRLRPPLHDWNDVLTAFL